MRLVLIGFGAIGREVAAGLPKGVTLAGVALRAGSQTELPDGVARIEAPQDLSACDPDLVIEAAGRAAVGPWGRAALALGADFVPSSASALTEDALLDELTQLAQENGAQVILPAGALGGLDALSAAALLPLHAVRHDVIKPPLAWRGTKAEALCDLGALSEAHVFWQGKARAAAAEFPQNANVAAISALAGVGLDQTEVRLIADPAASENRHVLNVAGDFGAMRLELANRPSARNPKTSALTALSLLRIVKNRIAPLVI